MFLREGEALSDAQYIKCTLLQIVIMKSALSLRQVDTVYQTEKFFMRHDISFSFSLSLFVVDI